MNLKKSKFSRKKNLRKRLNIFHNFLLKIFSDSKKTYITIGSLAGLALAACIAIPLALKGNGNDESLLFFKNKMKK